MKEIFSVIVVNIFIAVLVSGCLSGTLPSEKAGHIDISVQQGKEMIDSGEVFILDVRTQQEYDEGHIIGSTLIPVDELDGRLKELPRDKKILVYCRSGNRSLTASVKLENNGFTQIYNMKGGITEWKNAGYEVEK